MSWEVPSMKSKTSSFNRGVAKNLLLRFWPAWAAYFALLLMLWPASMLDRVQNSVPYYKELAPLLDQMTAGLGQGMIIVHFFAAVVAAMLMFSYLYHTRGCGMMNTLPVTRSSMFFTAWLTGLLPLLLCQLLAAGLCLPFAAQGYLSLRTLGILVGVSAMSTLAFYGFAVFCAMLTGSLIILPLVYGVLSFTAIVAEMATRNVLSRVLFGLDPDVSVLGWLSPPLWMLQSYQTEIREGTLAVQGVGVVALYAAAGLAFTVFAWLLYRKRKMETATDTVAIPILKPVFKYCMAYGCGVVFAAIFLNTFLSNQQYGFGGAAVTALAVLAGSLVGYFTAEMLIRKTVRVFRGTWRGWLIFAAAAVLLIGACEYGLFGWEKCRPDAGSVESVFLNGTEYREPESIKKILALQQSIVANKEEHEAPRRSVSGSSTVGTVELSYVLTNGRQISRRYSIRAAGEALKDENSDLAKLQRVLNLPEALRYRSLSNVTVKPGNVMYFHAYFEYYDTEREAYRSERVDFSAEQAVDFYENALLVDLTNDTVGRRFLFDDGKIPQHSNVSVAIEFADPEAEDGALPSRNSWYSITVYEDNTAMLAWLQAHCDREIRFYGTDGTVGVIW